MANAHFYSAGVELPNQGIAPVISPTIHDDKKDLGESGLQMIPGDDQVVHEQEMPEGPTVTRWEEWAYYLYYNGDSGVGPNGYSGTLFQSLATAAGYDRDTGEACGSGTCMLNFGGPKTVASVVLISQGISFGIMTLLFTTIGSCADYGVWNKWILIVATIVCWGSQFGFLGVWKPEQWHAAMALYMLGFITYGITLVFYASVFPRLARNTPRTKEARNKLDNQEIDTSEYEKVEMLERNRLSNISTAHSNWGYLLTLALNLSLLLPLANNPKVDNYTLAFTNCYWIVCGVPWFFLQKDRRGPPIPKGSRWFTIGWKQIWAAALQYRRLPYTFIYLFSFFLLADGLNTTGSVVSIVQNQHISFSFLQSTYLGLAQAATSIASCYGFWYLQRWKTFPTKRMFQVTNVITVLIPFWGMLGLWTDKIGFHNTWEFWLYNVVFGLGQAPYYAYAQTMMSDLTPPGYEGMFFGLFGITNRASSLIGPNVCSAIINRTGNSWDAFIFLFILCTCAALVIWVFVDMEKGRAQAVAFSIEQRGLSSDVRATQVTTVIGEERLDGVITRK
ncbi:MFS general substrate transporter [Naematelia encephala]|uniref:Autophagy-related protein n=1 Tax=Naematelia encephala TaxID=71784 RepID=A0A1Y2AGC4_9TREE|nr:MFS general substrate transporter [Naematelia encephala]